MKGEAAAVEVKWGPCQDSEAPRAQDPALVTTRPGDPQGCSGDTHQDTHTQPDRWQPGQRGAWPHVGTSLRAGAVSSQSLV